MVNALVEAFAALVRDLSGLIRLAGYFLYHCMVKRVLSRAPLLTTYTPSAKGSTRDYQWSIFFEGLVLPTQEKSAESIYTKHVLPIL